MRLFAESPKASKLRVEDSIVNTWMSGGYMVGVEGNFKTRWRSCVMSKDADKFLEHSFVWSRAATLHVWDVKT
jgi:hypothetical protein